MNHNDQSEQNLTLLQSLYRELAILKIRIAFAKIAEDEERELDAMPDEYSELAYKRALTEINRAFDKKARRRFLRKTVPFALQIIAGVLLLSFLTLTTATAASHSVRVRVLSFIMKVDEHYTELSMEDVNGESFEVPAEWQGYYYPSYIPEGFTLYYVKSYTNTVRYDLDDTHRLEFKEYDGGDYQNYDTEGSQIGVITLLGVTGYISQKDDTVYIVWSVDNHFFVLRFDGSLEESEKIARSVRMIR